MLYIFLHCSIPKVYAYTVHALLMFFFLLLFLLLLLLFCCWGIFQIAEKPFGVKDHDVLYETV